MADTRSARTAPPSVRDRRGLRITLLVVAAAILLLGVTAAGVYGYVAHHRPLTGAAELSPWPGRGSRSR